MRTPGASIPGIPTEPTDPSAEGVADRRFVVHCKRAAFDAYVGRGRDPNTGTPNAGWGNPFVIGRDGDRAAVIAKHRAWFLGQPDFVARAKRELKGRVLGCRCHPHPCHADTLADVANQD